MAKASKPKKPAAPKGLHLFGSDNKVYTVKDKSALQEVSSGGVSGYGMHEKHVSRGVPKEEDQGDVQGHDMQGGVWHRWWAWGYIYDERGNLIYAYHYHPYATPFAVYID